MSIRDGGLPESKDERRLRRLLAMRCGIRNLYTDDGEMSGQEHGLSFDFMRDTVEDLDAKLLALNLARFKQAEAAQPTQERKPLTEQEIWDAVQHGVIGGIGFPTKALAVARAIEAAHGIGAQPKGDA